MTQEEIEAREMQFEELVRVQPTKRPGVGPFNHNKVDRHADEGSILPRE
ncbi:MAG: hypothetical protein WKG07_01430 [Hymenobacter sp.]